MQASPTTSRQGTRSWSLRVVLLAAGALAANGLPGRMAAAAPPAPTRPAARRRASRSAPRTAARSWWSTREGAAKPRSSPASPSVSARAASSSPRTARPLYVALSGSPAGGPGVDESKLPPADRAADGIGVVDLASHKLVRTLPSGQDPESFDLSRDGKTLYVSNEETAEMSVLDLRTGKVTRRVAVGKEPEGVTVRPDGKVVYVTSEAGERGRRRRDQRRSSVLAQIPRARARARSPSRRDGKTGVRHRRRTARW